MSPHEERRSCRPRAKYGAGLGREIWAARRRCHPESLNNRTGPPTEELTGVRHLPPFGPALSGTAHPRKASATKAFSCCEFAPEGHDDATATRRGDTHGAADDSFRPLTVGAPVSPRPAGHRRNGTAR